MAQVSGYDDGQFSWVDLSSHDMNAAKAFYGSVFGWTCTDQETRDRPPYALFSLEGRGVGGLGQMSDEMKAMGIPPTWNSYINVDDIESVVRRARELGAKIMVPVMQMLDAGWLAFFRDPGGGQVALWQPGTHFGAETVNEPGSLCWNELATRDIEQARDFYGALLGWEFADHEGTPTRYCVIKNRGNDNGALMQMNEEWGDMPSHWMVYFAASDTDAAAARAEQAGGKICVAPFDTPVGRISVVTDPQGAAFSLIRLARVPG